MLAKANNIFVGIYYAWICADDVNIGRDGAASYRKSGKKIYSVYQLSISFFVIFIFSPTDIFILRGALYAYSTFLYIQPWTWNLLS